jgi:hypothetical protein
MVNASRSHARDSTLVHWWRRARPGAMTSDTHTRAPPPGDDPEVTAGELARRCGLCRAAIPGEFFLLRAGAVCPTCARGLQQRLAGRGRFRRALLWGGLAATMLASLWYLATVASSRPLSGLAVLAGIAVGLAVHWGSDRRGGLRYQVAAALLVYAVFVARYVPPVFGGIADAIKQQHTTATESAPSAAAPSAGAVEPTGHPPSRTTPPAPSPASQTSGWATLRAYFVFTVIAWGLVLASPFLPGSLGLLSLLCLALGMAAAVGCNRRVHLRGPFPGSGPS